MDFNNNVSSDFEVVNLDKAIRIKKLEITGDYVRVSPPEDATEESIAITKPQVIERMCITGDYCKINNIVAIDSLVITGDFAKILEPIQVGEVNNVGDFNEISKYKLSSPLPTGGVTDNINTSVKSFENKVNMKVNGVNISADGTNVKIGDKSYPCTSQAISVRGNRVYAGGKFIAEID